MIDTNCQVNELQGQESRTIVRTAGKNSEFRSRPFVEWCLLRSEERERAALRSRERWILLALVGWVSLASVLMAIWAS